MMKGHVVVLLVSMLLGNACWGGCLNQQPSQGGHIAYLLQHDETSADQWCYNPQILKKTATIATVR